MIARKIIINDIEKGGLKMADIRSFAKALKISWNKVWDVNYRADWKRLLFSDRLYWNDVWLLNKSHHHSWFVLLRKILSG